MSPIVIVTFVLAVAALGGLAYLGFKTKPSVEIRGSTKRTDICGRASDAFDTCMRRALKGGARNEDALQTCQSEFMRKPRLREGKCHHRLLRNMSGSRLTSRVQTVPDENERMDSSTS